jgi:uncharacterized DUF497 family protein
MNFIFDEEKNQKLFSERNLTFEQVINEMAEGRVLFDSPHPNQEKYSHQRILIVELNGNACVVPYFMDSEQIKLITIFPDRRYKKLLKDK